MPKLKFRFILIKQKKIKKIYVLTILINPLQS